MDKAGIRTVSAAGVAAVLCAAVPAGAADLAPPSVSVTGDIGDGGHTMSQMGAHGTTPAGVFGADMVGAGKFMFDYSSMFMHMQGNYVGTSQVSPQTIMNTPAPGGGKYLVIPNTMDMQSHMFHAMFGVTDWLNLMAMATYQIKSMNMSTFGMSTMSGMAGMSTMSGMSGMAGMSGMSMASPFLGTSSATTEGFGDTMVSAVVRLYRDPVNQVNLNVGFSLPTGSTTETISMLSPMGMFMNMRADYGMQLGTGTVDFVPGLSYTGHVDKWSWGAQWRSRTALDDNAQGYRWGDLHEFSGWGGYTWLPGVTTTVRVKGTIQDSIHGSDPAITTMAGNGSMMGIMMEGANPALYGGKRIDVLGGIEISGAQFGFRNVNVAIEAGAPVYQDLNGPQLGEAWQLTGALRVSF